MKTYWVYDEELIEDDPYTDPEERMDQTVVILTSDLPAALERLAEAMQKEVAATAKAHGSCEISEWADLDPAARRAWIEEATKAFYGGEK